MLNQVIHEMVKNASEEIGFPMCDENVEQVLIDLEHEYDIILSDDVPITVDLMQDICGTITSWKNNSRLNYC